MKSLFKALGLLCFVSTLTLSSAQASPTTLSTAIAVAMFAQPADAPLSAEKAKLVILALQLELRKSQMACKDVDAESSWESFTADISRFLNMDYPVVTITTDHAQPVVSVANGYGIHFNKVIFTTGADFKTLVAVQGVEEKQYDETINVGDLLNPVFEKRTIRVVDERFQCNSATVHN